MSNLVELNNRSRHALSITSNQNSLFATNNPLSVSNYASEWKIIEVLQGLPQLGSQSASFELYPYGDYLGDCILKLQVSGITGTNNATLCDWAGVFMLRHVSVYIGSVKVDEMTAEEIHHKWLHYKNREWYDSYKELVGGDLAYATRLTRYATSQTFYLPLPLFWSYMDNPMYFIPFANNQGVQDKVRIELNFKTPAEIFDCNGVAVNGTPVVSLVNVQMLAKYYTVSTPERSNLVSKLISGISLPMPDHTQKVLSEVLPVSASTEYRIKLQNLRSPVSKIFFIIRNVADIQTPNQNKPTNYQSALLSKWHLEGSGLKIITENVLENNLQLNYINIKRHNGIRNTKEYIYAFSYLPDNTDHNTGYLDFDQITNPLLVLNFATVLASAVEIELFAVVNNTITWKKTGSGKQFN